MNKDSCSFVNFIQIKSAFDIWPHGRAMGGLLCGICLNMTYRDCTVYGINQDSKVRGSNMGPTWVLSAPGGPHVDPMSLAIRVVSHNTWTEPWPWHLSVDTRTPYCIRHPPSGTRPPCTPHKNWAPLVDTSHSQGRCMQLANWNIVRFVYLWKKTIFYKPGEFL